MNPKRSRRRMISMKQIEEINPPSVQSAPLHPVSSAQPPRRNAIKTYPQLTGLILSEKDYEQANNSPNALKIDQNNIIYTQPDKDVFELHKGRILSMLIKQQVDFFHKSQETTFSPQLNHLTMVIENAINTNSNKLTNEEFETNFERVIIQEKKQEVENIKERKERAKKQMISMLDTVQSLLEGQMIREKTAIDQQVLERKQRESRSIKDWGLELVLFRPDLILGRQTPLINLYS